MVSWQFRCVCCGELRNAPMTRPEGTVYLRCAVSRQWAWYQPSAFVLAAGSTPALRDGADRARAPRPARRRTRVAARAARAGRGTSGRTRAAARTARGAARRKVAGRARRRR